LKEKKRWERRLEHVAVDMAERIRPWMEDVFRAAIGRRNDETMLATSWYGHTAKSYIFVSRLRVIYSDNGLPGGGHEPSPASTRRNRGVW